MSQETPGDPDGERSAWVVTWGEDDEERRAVVLRAARIGRARDNDVALSDPEVAPYHCRLVAAGEFLILERAEGAPDVLLNDAPLGRPVALAPGDVLRVGGTLLHVGVVAQEPAEAPAVQSSSPVDRLARAAWLEEASGVRHELGAETRIGREQGNDIVLVDPLVSRRHARIRHADEDYFLEDLGSANGTYINDELLDAPRPLRHGERVRFASTEFAFRSSAPDEAPDLPVALDGQSALDAAGKAAIRGDLRIVTVVFAYLKNFTEISERLSPDQVALVVNQCFSRLTRVTSRYGGYVDKYAGGRMMVLFGAPQAHEDDAERAVRAAVAMQAELRRFAQQLHGKAAVDLHLRVGINTGEVMAGWVGAEEFAAFTVLGDSVNAAAWLEEAAPAGGILVGEATQRLTHHAIRYRPRSPVPARNSRQVVEAFEFEALAQDSGDLDAGTRFVARTVELAKLEQLFDRPTAGFRSAAIIGETGSGSARLLAEVRRTRGNRVRWAGVRCVEYDQLVPHSALRGLIQSLLHLEVSHGHAGGTTTMLTLDPRRQRWVELAGLLAEPGDSDGEGEVRPAAATVLEEFVQLVRHCAEGGRPAEPQGDPAPPMPLVLAIQGTQWADADSLAALQAAVAQLQDVPLLLLVTARPGWTQHWPNEACWLELAPLPPQECAEVVAALLDGGPVDPAAADLLCGRSDGTPLFLEEMVRAAVEAGSLRRVEGTWRLMGELDLVKAPAIRTIIQARLDHLHEEERRVLQVGAVVGQRWQVSTVERLLDDALFLQDIIQTLVRQQQLVLREEGGEVAYEYRHRITQAVAYASLPVMERRRLHIRTAEILEERLNPADPDPDALRQVAAHYTRARRPDRAARALRDAAVSAADEASPAVVEELYRDALRQAWEVGEGRDRAMLLAEIEERLADLLYREARMGEARGAYETARSFAVAPEDQARLGRKLALVALRGGDHPRAVELVSRALALAPPGSEEAVRSEALLARTLAAQGHLEPALEHAGHAVETAGATAAAGMARIALGMARRLGGDLPGSVAVLTEVATATPTEEAPLEPLEARALLVEVQAELGGPADALRGVAEMVRLVDPTRGGLVSADLAVLELYFHATQAAGHGAQQPWAIALAELAFARVLLQLRQGGTTLQVLRDAQSLAEASAIRVLALRASIGLGEAELAAGRADDSVRILGDAAGVAESLGLGPLACEAQTLRAEALAALGDHPSAVASARLALEHAEEHGLPLHEARARRALGVSLAAMANWEEARPHFEAAVATFERAGARPDLMRTLIPYALEERRFGGREVLEVVTARLQQAADLAAACGLPADQAAAREAQAKVARHSEWLPIEIDEERKERDVSQILKSDYFQQLRQKARTMRDRPRDSQSS